MRYRGFDGFIAAIAPFNFTAIAGNLAYTPALMVSIFFLYILNIVIIIIFILSKTLTIHISYNKSDSGLAFPHSLPNIILL